MKKGVFTVKHGGTRKCMAAAQRKAKLYLQECTMEDQVPLTKMKQERRSRPVEHLGYRRLDNVGRTCRRECYFRDPGSIAAILVDSN